jgi:shikimate kinase
MSADATTATRRPNLTAKGPLDEIVHVLEKRTPVYRQSAHLEIDTEGKSPAQLAEEILAALASGAEPLTPDPGLRP